MDLSEIKGIIDLGGTFVIALMLIKLNFNELKHINDLLIEIRDALVKKSKFKR